MEPGREEGEDAVSEQRRVDAGSSASLTPTLVYLLKLWRISKPQSW